MKPITANTQSSPAAPLVAPAARGQRRPYRRPRLVAYGNVRDLTMGSSPGPGESGPGNQTRRSPFFYGDDLYGEFDP
jgi:hypothetical protein